MPQEIRPPQIPEGRQTGERMAAHASESVNDHGFPALPLELVLEILSYFLSSPVPSTTALYEPLPPGFSRRTKTTRLLSQLCRSLRTILLPFAWRTIEVCSLKARRWASSGSGTFKLPDGRVTRTFKRDLARDLVRQLETVTIRNPSLANYVQ